jgi:hypothetical protein
MYQTKEYALYRLRNRLNYLESAKPILYEAFSEDGKFYCSFFEKTLIKEFQEKGFIVREADIKKEIEDIKNSIAYYEKLDE